MTSDQAKALTTGDEVDIMWPGSNSGVNRKRGRVAIVNKAGTKVGVKVAKTTPRGRYTGEYGTSVRWFMAYELDRAEG